MRQRPWILVVLAALHILAPIGNIAMNALLMKRNVLDYFTYAMQAEYLQRNWFVIVAPLVAGVAIYACKKWSFFVYIVAITVLFVFSYSGYLSKADSISLVPVIFVYLINIAVVSYFLVPAVRQIYFDPRLRWWESLPRYRCDFDCTWTYKGKTVPGKVGNFSLNGLFFKSDEFPEDGAEIDVSLNRADADPAQFKGHTILHGRQDAVGFGVKFVHTKESHDLAKSMVDNLDAQGMKLTYRAPNNEDTFSFWLKNLVTTGRGLLPKRDK